MKKYRNEIMPGVWLTVLNTDKFKTGHLCVKLLTALTRENASKNAVLPSVLRRGSVRYPDMDALAARLDDCYGATLVPTVSKAGEIQLLGLEADFIDSRYLPDGTDLTGEMAALLGEVLLHPRTRGGLLLPAYVDSEKEMLLDDIRSVINDKASYAHARLREQMFAAESYAVSSLGSEDTTENIHYVSLSKHYRQVLASSPIEIFYIGSADKGLVTDAVRQALRELPRGEIDYDIGTDIRMNTLEEQTRYYTEGLPVTQGKLCVGFRLGSCMEDPDLSALQVLNALYGGSAGSKLFVNVREKRGLCYYASSGIDLMKGVLTVDAGIDFDRYDEVLDQIMQQLQAVKDGDFTADELTIAKATEITALRAAGESVAGLRAFWLRQTLLGLDYGPEEAAALIDEVTREDIIAAAADIACDAVFFLKNSDGEDAQNHDA